MDPNDTNAPDTDAPEIPEVETSLRDDIESSLAELTQAEAPETPAPEAPETPAPESAEAPVRDDGRDALGRFAKKDKPAGPAGAAEPAGAEPPAGAPSAAAPAGPPSPTEAPPPAAPEPTERAPQSWKPLAREAWSKIPAEARQEVLRRESEVQRVLQESATARKTYSEFQEAVRPYEAMIRAEAGDPIRAVAGLLDTAYKLRNSPPAQKAQIIATLVKGYGVDIEALDNALVGQPPPAHAAAMPHDPRVDQLYQLFQQSEQARQQQALAAAKAQIEEAASNLEFFEDVREEVADILDLAGKRGQKMTVRQAYDRAVMFNEDIQRILQQRKAAERAPAAQAQVQRAKAAAASVPSRPAVAPPRPRGDTSLREDLEETMRELQGR